MQVVKIVLLVYFLAKFDTTDILPWGSVNGSLDIHVQCLRISGFILNSNMIEQFVFVACLTLYMYFTSDNSLIVF